MKKIIKILTLVLCLYIISGCSVFASSISKVLFESNINKSAVAISIKDVRSGKVVYELNSHQPMPPASTLKIVTFKSALDTLGCDYEFTTALYKTVNNELILKLGADPYLTSSNLNQLLRTAKAKNIIEPKEFYIDDSIIDKTEWGEGWQWDDDLNPLMPKFSAYNIDGNLLSVIIVPTVKGAPPEIRTAKFYPTTFLNLVTTEDQNNIVFNRKNHISPDIITAEGTVRKKTVKNIPVNNPERYFKIRLEEAIRNEKIDYYKKFPQIKTPDKNIYLVDKITHPINKTIIGVLKESNNMMAETVYKLAGGKFSNETGTEKNANAMLKAYCSKFGIDISEVKIIDGSGVSKNNLVTSDFMTDFLLIQSKNECFDEFRKMLPTPGEGTLSDRMLYFKDKLFAKTGTLSDVSGIAGYITTSKGNTYAFDIMINDPKSKISEKKALEEYILRAVYSNY